MKGADVAEPIRVADLGQNIVHRVSLHVLHAPPHEGIPGGSGEVLGSGGGIGVYSAKFCAQRSAFTVACTPPGVGGGVKKVAD